MSTPSGRLPYSIDRSDPRSRSERIESNQQRPEEDDEAARSRYAPKRARLMQGGPPIRFGKAVVIDVPRFLVSPDRRESGPGQSKPAEGPRTRSPCPTSSSPELLGSAKPIRAGPVSPWSPASIPALRLNIERPGASLPCLMRQDAEFGRLPADPISPQRHHQTPEKAAERIGLHGPPEPGGLVPPALVRAQRRKAGASLLTSPYGPLPILVAGLFAAVVYLMTENQAPRPDAAADPKLATIGLETTIAPPLPARQNEMRPFERRGADPEIQTSPTGETWSRVPVPSAARAGILEGPDGDIEAPKRAAGSFAAAKARSGAGLASRQSTRAIPGSRRCGKRCTGSSCPPNGACASGKKDSARAHVPAARKGLPTANTNPRGAL
jgi:hypothetical protein